MCCHLYGNNVFIKVIDHVEYRFEKKEEKNTVTLTNHSLWSNFSMLRNLYILHSFIFDYEQYIYNVSELLLMLPMDKRLPKWNSKIHVKYSQNGISWKDYFLDENNLNKIERIHGYSERIRFISLFNDCVAIEKNNLYLSIPSDDTLYFYHLCRIIDELNHLISSDINSEEVNSNIEKYDLKSILTAYAVRIYIRSKMNSEDMDDSEKKIIYHILKNYEEDDLRKILKEKTTTKYSKDGVLYGYYDCPLEWHDKAEKGELDHLSRQLNMELDSLFPIRKLNKKDINRSGTIHEH